MSALASALGTKDTVTRQHSQRVQRYALELTRTIDPELATDPAILAEMQKAVDEANRMVSKAEQIKKFIVLDTDLTEETGHVTPSLKLKRDIVARDFAKQIESLYG